MCLKLQTATSLFNAWQRPLPYPYFANELKKPLYSKDEFKWSNEKIKFWQGIPELPLSCPPNKRGFPDAFFYYEK